MKNVLRQLLLASCCGSLAASAQITIGPADMPEAGDTVRYQTGLTTADMADTGADHSWDFSNLEPGGEAADTIVSVGSTPLLYQFFFNNPFIYPENNADFAMRGADLGLQGFTLDEVFNYYKSDDDGYRDVGFGASVNDLPTSVQRTPVDWIYRFPLAYGNVDSSASHFEISVPTLGFYGQDQMRRNEVDGWGTLYLPADTFQVLRVKSRIQRTDTVYIDQFGFGFSIPEPETIEYKWLAQGMDEPVLQVTTVAGVNTVVRFFYEPEDITTSVAVMEAPATWQVWPNPAKEFIHVEGIPNGSLELVASDGRVVRTMAASKGSMDVRSLAPGAYVLRSVGDGTAHRVVVAH